MDIQRLSLEHVSGIAELEKECFSAPWTEDGIKEELDNPNAMFFMAMQGDKVVGYIGAHLIVGECYITNIAVSGECRRKGMGTALLNKLLESLKKADADFVTLEVRKSNEPAIRMYTANGFDINGERKDFYADPKEDAYIMTKYFKGDDK